MRNYKTILFLSITFLWTWTNWFIGLHYLTNGSQEDAINRFVRCFFIGVYGPAISAILTTLYLNGFNETIALLKKLTRWQAPIVVYLTIIVGPIVCLGIGVGLYAWLLRPVGHFDPQGVRLIPTVLIGSLFAGPLGEELGWRGLLLPELQKRFSAFQSSLLIGFVWYSWHIPLFFAPFGTLVSGQPLTPVPLLIYLIFVLCLSCLYTWLVNKSKGSVLMALLIHLSINAGIILLFFPDLRDGAKMCYFLATAPLLLFILYLGVKTGFESTDNTYRIS